MIVTLYKTAANGALLYYTVHDRQTGLLSQPYSLSVTWSRGTGRGREKFYLFDTLEEKDRMTRKLLNKRTKDGYRLLYSFSRDAAWSGESEGHKPSKPGQPRRKASG
jgi:hypothetical protein